MRKRVFILAFCSLLPVLVEANPLIFLSGRPPVAGGGPAAFSDTFSGTLSSWTSNAGTQDISSGQLRFRTGSFGDNNITYNTSTGSVTQYVAITIGTGATSNSYPLLVVRFTNSSSAFYGLEITGSNSELTLYHYASVGGATTSIGTAAPGFADGTGRWGMTVEGTGTSTVWRVWKGITGVPTSSTNWNGDTTPDVTFTNDPASPVNTGQLVGVAGVSGSADYILLDDFNGGGL